MEYSQRERLIKSLEKDFKNTMLDSAKEVTHTYDESTGTYYCLTGQTEIPEATIKGAFAFFKKEFSQSAALKEEYTKSVYCAVAIEAINFFLINGNTHIDKCICKGGINGNS